MKGFARRGRDILLPDAGTRQYRRWIDNRLKERGSKFGARLKPGLLSIITPIWNGSPVKYLRELAASITPQMKGVTAEWVIVDNGCAGAELLACLDELRRLPFVTLHRSETNLGIVKGLRTCLERARNRYVLPVDADDLLYPDALRIVAASMEDLGYPALLYTDEDKTAAGGVSQPYFKPDWDPVLLSNSAYIAHLGVADRALALSLGAYTDGATEGSADWDLFMRFANAGYAPVHIPEIVYSWRVHVQSTADDAAVKPYILSSQRTVMERFLQAQAGGSLFRVEPNPLFGPGAAHFHFVRTKPSLRTVAVCRSDSLPKLAAMAEKTAEQNGVVCLEVGVAPQHSDWINEAVGTFELFPDTVMVGGRISDSSSTLVDGAQVFGFGGLCQAPDAGRKLTDPGYFGQAWKIRTANAVSARMSAIDAGFLFRALRSLPSQLGMAHLGSFLGAEAMREGHRVIYNPLLHAIAPDASPMPDTEADAFRSRYSDLIPDRRCYPEPFSLTNSYEISKTGQ